MSKLLSIFILGCLLLLAKSEPRNFLDNEPPEITQGVRICMFENKLYLIALYYIYSFDGKSWILIDKAKPSLPLNLFVCSPGKVYGASNVNKIMEHLLTKASPWVLTGDAPATPGLGDDAIITSIISTDTGLFVTGKDSSKSGVFHLSFADGKWVRVGDFFEGKNLITSSEGKEGEGYVGVTMEKGRSEVYKYCLKDGKWYQLGESIPIILSEVHFSKTDGFIYAGGWDSSSEFKRAAVYKFDPAANNKWTLVGRNIDLGKYGRLGEIRVINGKLFTWIRSDVGHKGSILRYDEASNSWIELFRGPWRILLGMFKVENDIYVFAREERGYGVFKLNGLNWDRIGSTIVPQESSMMVDLDWFDLYPTY